MSRVKKQKNQIDSHSNVHGQIIQYYDVTYCGIFRDRDERIRTQLL